jgi:hypothetical protein
MLTTSSFSFGFYLAFHGINDRVLREGISKLFSTVCPTISMPHTTPLAMLTPAAPPTPTQQIAPFSTAAARLSDGNNSGKGGRGARQLHVEELRLAFVSRFFNRHSVGLLLRNLMRQLQGSYLQIGTDRWVQISVGVFYLARCAEMGAEHHESAAGAGRRSCRSTNTMKRTFAARNINGSMPSFQSFRQADKDNTDTDDVEEFIRQSTQSGQFYHSQQNHFQCLPSHVGKACKDDVEQLAHADNKPVSSGHNATAQRHENSGGGWYEEVPGDIAAARASIVRWSPHVAIFTEIGMDSVAYFLAHSRVAPIQLAWWGHPDTSGMDSIDYFLSLDSEVKEGGDHYSEQMVRLSGLGTSFLRPREGPHWDRWGDVKPEAGHLWSNEAKVLASLYQHTRKSSASDSSGHNLSSGNTYTGPVYVCVQALFKVHPHFVDAIVSILEQELHSNIIFIWPHKDFKPATAWDIWSSNRGTGAETASDKEDSNGGGDGHRHPFFANRTKTQMNRIGDNWGIQTAHHFHTSIVRKGLCPHDENVDHCLESFLERVQFIARMGRQQLLAIARSATAVLDTFPFGGGVTSLQTLAMGAALVTLPSHFLSGRLTLGMYKELNLGPSLDCCVASNATHYASLSLRLARDPEYRRKVRRRTMEESHRLFENEESVEEWRQFLQLLGIGSLSSSSFGGGEGS